MNINNVNYFKSPNMTFGYNIKPLISPLDNTDSGYTTKRIIRFLFGESLPV